MIFFFIGRLIGRSFWENFIFAIGIIVANVPESLLQTMSLFLAMASQRMAKRNALIRNLPAVEALGCTTVICTDKTGTLTQNRMSAKRLCIAGLVGLEDPPRPEILFARVQAEQKMRIVAALKEKNETRPDAGDRCDVCILFRLAPWRVAFRSLLTTQ